MKAASIFKNELAKRLQSNKDTFAFLRWFILCNTLIFCVLCIPYLKIILSSQTLYDWPYLDLYGVGEHSLMLLGLFSAYLGQCGLLVWLPILLIILPLSLFLRYSFIVFLSISTVTITITTLIADILVFLTYHFHINLTILPLVSPTDLSRFEWFLTLLTIAVIIVIELVLCYLIHHFLMRKNKLQIFSELAIFLLPVSLIISYTVYITSAQTFLSTFTQQTPILPLYNQVLAFVIEKTPVKLDVKRSSESLFAQPKLPTNQLYYPKKPLVFGEAKNPYNIVMIVIDAWRFDALNEKLTPNLYQFAKTSWYFKNHTSGGNCTEAGLASLLYSLPHLYWSSLRTAKKGAVLIDGLHEKNYQTQVFFSSFMVPRFDQTAFVKIANLRTKLAAGKTIPDRDRTITREWHEYIEKRDKNKPFFTFSLFDSAHGYCSEQNIPTLYETKDCDRTFLNEKKVDNVHKRYLNAVHFIDQQIQQMLATLKEQKLLDNTIVIITGDHGEEFFDTDLKYYGHSSNYSIYQTQVPLIVYWPKEKPQVFTHNTSHYDIVPTLMKEVLNVKNDSKDYSIGGKLLWDPKQKQEFIIAGSYINSALLESNRRTILLSSGDIEITDIYNKQLPKATVNKTILAKALSDLRWFYQPVK